ncbi:hypothetical protein GCM10010195_34140 [Kitasatospora griseola]|nr:hypothetical protein GCM10010195_34140 [Kitasatospora griseola]
MDPVAQLAAHPAGHRLVVPPERHRLDDAFDDLDTLTGVVVDRVLQGLFRIDGVVRQFAGQSTHRPLLASAPRY